MDGLEVVRVSKSYDEVQALRSLSMAVLPAEIVAVLGPSGCGKSTLLSIIAGLETPDDGDVLWDGASLKSVPPHQRNFGLMFQDFALFPHMSVADNVAFGLRMSRMADGEIQDRTAEMLALVGLEDYGGRDPGTLSGGEAQRVALARALAPRPRLLMLDEPLGSLDRSLSERLLSDLGSILRRMKQPTIYVTHDQEEAFSLADRVVLMDQGQSVQTGTPEEIYHHPVSPFVARFLGFRNLLDGEALLENGETVIRTKAGAQPGRGRAPGPVKVLLRPDRASLNGAGDVHLNGVVLERAFRGDHSRLNVDVESVSLSFDFPSDPTLPSPGETITISLDSGDGMQVWSDVED
ncbi:MAG: ABC transporter ATP-binding protein [Anaerolineales bacterium]|nr:ABC transporter ATP-binding protein [Anaerolineales bacterium]